MFSLRVPRHEPVEPVQPEQLVAGVKDLELVLEIQIQKSSIPSPFSNGECCKCACFFFSHLVCDRLPLHYCPQLLLALLYHGGGPRVCAGVGVIPRRDRGLLPAKRFSLNLKEVELCEKWSVFLPASRLLLGLQAAQGDLPLDLERSLEQK